MKPQTLEALESAAESALIAFGPEKRMIKTCEECAELIMQLSKRLAGSPTTEEAIIDEVADVLVMVFGMRKHFGADAVDARALYKLNRTIDAIRRFEQAKKETTHDH